MIHDVLYQFQGTVKVNLCLYVKYRVYCKQTKLNLQLYEKTTMYGINLLVS